MATNALYSPLHRVLGRLPSADGGLPYNAAPGLDYLGGGLQDHRLTYNKQNSTTGFGIIGWFGGISPVYALNITPSAIATANIAALANVSSGVAMTLVSTSGSGITVLATATTFWPSLNSVPVGACVIDSVPTPLAFGNKFRTGVYDRSKMCARAVSITGVSGGAGGQFNIAGYDVYGYAMTEAITATAGATTTNGKKAWKAVVSVTPQFTDAHNYSVGTTDIYGIPIQCPIFGDAEIYFNSAAITASTGFVVPDTTSPATTTTGDVRGTYATQSASDGTKTLQVRVYASAALTNTNPTTGLFGVAQT